MRFGGDEIVIAIEDHREFRFAFVRIRVAGGFADAPLRLR
jgi:hypothetical protein